MSEITNKYQKRLDAAIAVKEELSQKISKLRTARIQVLDAEIQAEHGDSIRKAAEEVERLEKLRNEENREVVWPARVAAAKDPDPFKIGQVLCRWRSIGSAWSRHYEMKERGVIEIHTTGERDPWGQEPGAGDPAIRTLLASGKRGKKVWRLRSFEDTYYLPGEWYPEGVDPNKEQVAR